MTVTDSRRLGGGAHCGDGSLCRGVQRQIAGACLTAATPRAERCDSRKPASPKYQVAPAVSSSSPWWPRRAGCRQHGGHIKMSDTSGNHDHCLRQQALWAQPAAGPSSQPHECRGGRVADAPGAEPCLPACAVGE